MLNLDYTQQNGRKVNQKVLSLLKIIFVTLNVNFNFTLLANIFHQKFGFAHHLSFLIGADACGFEELKCLEYGRHD